MGIRRRVYFVLHVARPPGSIGTGGVDQPNGKFVQIFQGASDRLTGSECYRNPRFRVFWIQHPLFEFKALVTRCYSGKISRRRMAVRTSARAVEELPPGVDISGLEIADIHTLPSTLFGERVVLLGMDKSYQTRNLVIRKVKTRHAFVRASIAHHGTDVVSIHVRGHQLRTCKIRSTFTARSTAAMTKRAILPEKRFTLLD